MRRVFKKSKPRRFHRGAVSKGVRRPPSPLNPEADVRLKKTFAKIGAPVDRPFKPDRFQLEAVEAIRKGDCLVSAPTGSGKTWIAQEAIGRILKKGGRAWYASPLKALTNSKLIEFAEAFGHDVVGILTGDRKENPDAPVIVGTTEILRNQLYDAMHEGADLRADLVVLDEAHFLGDESRGVVWEETMIYLPHRVPLLLLSATIKNARQIAAWLETIRDKTCHVVEEKKRPVPLYPLFFHPSGKLLPLLDDKGVDRKVKKYLNNQHPPPLSSPRQLPPFAEVLRVLRTFHLLPAIFFMKSRADCDASLDRCLVEGDPDSTRNILLEERIADLTAMYPHLAGHRQMGQLRQAAVAAHHAGQLPAWKLLIERLMTEGFLDAVFATSTVAAGVNFPARSVVFLNSDRYNGRQFIPLDATEFHQATGRAGRRGKDRIGFAIIMPGPFMDVSLAATLFGAPSEKVVSRLRVDFPMVLNLLLSHKPEEIEEIFQRSFATYLNLANQRPGHERKLKQLGSRLMKFLPGFRCSGPDAVLAWTRRRKVLMQEISLLNRQFKGMKSHLAKIGLLIPGRLFLDHRGRMYCVVNSAVQGEQWGVMACRFKRVQPQRGGPLKWRWFPVQKVSTILNRVLDLPPSQDDRAIAEALGTTEEQGGIRPLDDISFGEQENSQLLPLQQRLMSLEEESARLVCNECKHIKRCHGKLHGAFERIFREFAAAWDSTNAVRMRLANDFSRHLQFLKEEGFVADDNMLTDDGKWASKLRLDQPLMIAEGLRKGVFPASDPALLAGLIAPFVHDRDVEEILETTKIPTLLLDAFENVKQSLTPLAERMATRGFEVRPMMLWTSATSFAWAQGYPWERVLGMSGISEGDLSMLILRTAENLRQMVSLAREYPAISQTAGRAIDLILREPVIIK